MNIFKMDMSEAKDTVKKIFSTDEKFSFCPDKIFSSTSYCIADSLSALDCLTLIRDKKTDHIMQNSIQSLEDKLELLKLIDYKNEDFFEDKLSILNADKVSTQFNIDTDRTQLVEKTFQDINLNLDMVKYQYLHQVAIELVMNAQIDAPKISNYKAVNDSILIMEKNAAKGLFAISVIDFYGSLDSYKMLENIYAAHKNGFRNSMSKNSIGAGLGSAMIYEYSDSLFIGVLPNKISRVTAILPLGISEKKTIQIQKSIHLVKEL